MLARACARLPPGPGHVVLSPAWLAESGGVLPDTSLTGWSKTSFWPREAASASTRCVAARLQAESTAAGWKAGRWSAECSARQGSKGSCGQVSPAQAAALHRLTAMPGHTGQPQRLGSEGLRCTSAGGREAGDRRHRRSEANPVLRRATRVRPRLWRRAGQGVNPSDARPLQSLELALHESAFVGPAQAGRAPGKLAVSAECMQMQCR